MKECPECTMWAANIESVVAPQRLAFARNPRPENEYRGIPFIYCPWCGAALREKLAPAVTEKHNE